MSESTLSLSGLAAEVRRRSTVLYWTGLAHLILGGLLLIAMPFDDGVVLGIDRLIKPFKFAVSIGIYSWTFAWFLAYIQSSKMARVLAWLVTISMAVEIIPITLQSLRGTLSHYNVEDALGIAMFSLMGTFIAINTVCAVVLAGALLWKAQAKLSKEYLLGVRLGMVLFLVGSAVGGALVSNQGHTVGAADGGPGLPLVNFSSEAGDLRVAHALGLHAMQGVPLFAFFLLTATGLRGGKAQFAISMFALAWGLVTVAAYLQAMAGKPLLG